MEEGRIFPGRNPAGRGNGGYTCQKKAKDTVRSSWPWVFTPLQCYLLSNMSDQNYFLGYWQWIGLYPHKFYNGTSLKHGKNVAGISFPNEGTFKGNLEFPLLRSPQGQICTRGINLDNNPDRVVFRLDAQNTVSFLGLMSHAGSLQQGYAWNEFVVSCYYYWKTYLVCQPSKVNKEYVANGRRRSGLVLI